MSTTVQDVIDRAVALSVANQGLATNTPDLIYRVNQFQRARWTQFTDVNRYFYQRTESLTSTAANGSRVVDLTGLSILAERVLRVRLANGTEVSLVDVQYQDAELAPRYYASGETLVEVSTDWDTASANAVTLTIDYCWRPADLESTGSTSQAVSIPDGYVGMLVDQLGAYFALSDFGRMGQSEEVDRLTASAEATCQAWIASAGHYAGVAAYRIQPPTPSPKDKR